MRLILDNGTTHAPKQLEVWLAGEGASGQQPIDIEVCWLPPNASWLDQLEIWFSILQRKLLQPNHFPQEDDLIEALLHFMTAYNREASPIKWSYTLERLQHKLGMQEG